MKRCKGCGRSVSKPHAAGCSRPPNRPRTGNGPRSFSPKNIEQAKAA